MTRSGFPTRHLYTLSSHTGPINCVAFSKLGGTYILTGSSDRSIHLSRTEPSSSTTSTGGGATHSLSTSTPTSSALSSATTAKTKASVITSPIQKYTSHGYAVLSISVSSTNTHFASTGGDRSVFYWDIQTPSTTLRRFGSNTNQGHTSRITCCSFAGVGDGVLVSGSDDRTVRLWDVKSRDSRPLQILDEARDSISSLLVAATSGGGAAHDIITGSIDGRIRTYDIRMGKVISDVQPGPITSLDLSDDGKILLVSCLDSKIRMMDRMNGSLLRTLPPDNNNNNNNNPSSPPPPSPHSASTLPPGNKSSTSPSQNQNRPKTSYKNKSLRLQSCFGADGAFVLSGSEEGGVVRAWDVITGNLVQVQTVSETDKVVSVVKWRSAGSGAGRDKDKRDVWAAGGADGLVRIYGY